MGLGLNCLLKDTALYKRMSDFMDKYISTQKIGSDVPFTNVFKELVNSSFKDVELDTIGHLYKDSIQKFAGKYKFDTPKTVDTITGKAVDKEVKNILFGNKVKSKDVEGNKPSTNAAVQLIKLFKGDYLSGQGVLIKTQMLEMQDALKKAATALLKRNNKTVEKKSYEDIIADAFYIDELGFDTLQGTVNRMDDLMNQLSDDLDNIERKMEASKKGKTSQKKDEIDLQIQQFKAYRENIVQGAYTLALSRSEARTVLHGLMKDALDADGNPKYTKQVKNKTVLDWNKTFKGSPDFETDVADTLAKKGYSAAQINKMINALKTEFDALRASAAYNNIAKITAKKAVDDDAFLTDLAQNILMAGDPPYKKWSSGTFLGNDKNGNPQYSKEGYIFDKERYEEESGKTFQQFKDEVKADISGGEISKYRNQLSKLKMLNNPARNVKKGDVQRLIELKDINGFDEKFNQKAYSILGLGASDYVVATQIETLVQKADAIMRESGSGSVLSMKLINNEINELLANHAKTKSGLFRLAKLFEDKMFINNSWRLASAINVVQNNIFNLFQIMSADFGHRVKDNRLAKRNRKLAMKTMRDVALGGVQFDINSTENLSIGSYDHRVDFSKGFSHNVKAALTVIPNILLQSSDAAAHSMIFSSLIQRNLVKVETSRRLKEAVEKLRTLNGGTFEAAEKEIYGNKSLVSWIEKSVVSDVADWFTDEKLLKEAEEKARRALAIVNGGVDANGNIIEGEVNKSELYRESFSYLLKMIGEGKMDGVAKDKIIDEKRMQLLIDSANASSRKAIGKGRPLVIPLNLEKIDKDSRENTIKHLKSGNYMGAAANVFARTYTTMGVFPFVRGIMNFAWIGAKTMGLGYVSGGKMLYDTIRGKNAEMVKNLYDMSDADMFKALKNYNDTRQNLFYAIQGSAALAITASILLAKRAFDDDDDDKDALEYFDDILSNFMRDERGKKTVMQVLGGQVALYNELRGNIPKNKYEGRLSSFEYLIDNYGGTITKPPVLTNLKYSQGNQGQALLGTAISPLLELGSPIGSAKDWYDAVQWNEDDGVKAVSWDNFFAKKGTWSTIVSSIMGYQLNKDINQYFDYKPRKK